MSFITRKRQRTDGNISDSDEVSIQGGRHGGRPRRRLNEEEAIVAIEARRLKDKARKQATREQQCLNEEETMVAIMARRLKDKTRKQAIREQQYESRLSESEAPQAGRGRPQIYTSEEDIEEAAKIRRNKQQARMERLRNQRRFSREVYDPSKDPSIILS